MSPLESRGGFDPTMEQKKPDRALDAKKRRIIPESEMEISFVCSGGAGGQKVNKTSSKAVLRWHIGRSDSFSPTEKGLIRKKLKATEADEIVLKCDEQRSQPQNKAACIERLHQKLHEAIQVDAERVPTKKSKGVKNREAESDFREKKSKAGRGRVDTRE